MAWSSSGYQMENIPLMGTRKNKGIGWLAALQLSPTFFGHVDAEMLKTCVFHMFPLWKAFSKLHLVLRGPIQNSENAFSLRKTLIFFTLEKKEFVLSQRYAGQSKVTISMLSQSHAGQQCIFQLCHKHFGSSSKMKPGNGCMMPLCASAW